MSVRPRAIPISSIERPKPGMAFGSARATLVPSNYGTEYLKLGHGPRNQDSALAAGSSGHPGSVTRASEQAGGGRGRQLRRPIKDHLLPAEEVVSPASRAGSVPAIRVQVA